MLERREQEQLLTLMQKHGGNISRVARELGVSRNTIYRKIRKAAAGESIRPTAQ
jgi:transcriptional regulator of acetoin/glycerol metabolism